MAKSKKKTVQQKREVRAVEPEVVHEPHTEVEETDAKSPVVKIIAVILVLIGLYLLLNFISDRRDDNGDKAADDSETSQVEDTDKAAEAEVTDDAALEDQPTGTTVKETDEEFAFTVGGGESYTTMARRAVASTDGELTLAERVAAETKLTTEAGAEWLNEGQGLTLSKETVRAAVDWAKSLSDEQKAAWQPYADLVAWQ